MPVCNVEKYIQQSVDSIIHQTLDFRNNVEIIIIDDGSVDGTGSICLEYSRLYPDNIIYIKQKNKGVSAARNRGLSLSRGKYINFFDGDDIWEKRSLKKLFQFIEKHTDEIDVVAANIKLFDADISPHPLSYKFNKTQVIDLSQNPDNPILHIISCLIKREALLNKQFDTRLKISEDAKLLSELLVDKKKYGVVSNTLYNYRKRKDQSSAIGTSRRDKSYYLATPRYAYLDMIKTWLQSGKLHPFMQHTLLYDIHYRLLFMNINDVLDKSEINQYNKLLKSVIDHIDEPTINNSRWLTDEQRNIIIRVKNGYSLLKQINNKTNYKKGDFQVSKNKLLHVLFNWRFKDAARQLLKLRSYNLSQLTFKSKLFEISKPLLIIIEAIFDIPRAIILRSAYYITKSRIKSPIWLISDRGMSGGDNGEALFRYIQTLKSVEADVYFVISKKAKDAYKRISKIGKVLNQNSWRYLLKFLLADKIISSHADIEVTNPFIRQKSHYEDLFNFDFVFLQHGVIHNDLSSWLNKVSKNIKLFITTSDSEYKSILSPKYGYTKKEVKLTGLPRYDLLENNPSNKLIIAPTYRVFLLNTKTNKSGARPYDPEFTKSEYFKFYNNLINDKKVLRALKNANMTGDFYIHPNFSAQTIDFNSNEVIKIAKFPYDYKRAISEGSLLVSDYSSIIFDFAYLKKPVIYAQFDKKKFFSDHTSVKDDFWDYERDGFGPVASSYEETLREIIKVIEDKCEMSKKYIKRAEEFFVYFDKNNSKRVYEAIKKIKKSNQGL